MFRCTRESSAGLVYVASAPSEQAAPVPPIAGDLGPQPKMSSGDAWADDVHASMRAAAASPSPGLRIDRAMAGG